MTEYDMNYFEKFSKELEVSEDLSFKELVWTVWANHILETYLGESSTKPTYEGDFQPSLDPSFYSWVSWGISYLEQNSSYSGNEISVFFREVEEQLQENFRLISNLQSSSVNTLS